MSKITDWFSKAKTFLSEVRSEWSKVTKPNRRDVTITTAVVLVTSVVFAVYLWLADLVIIWLYGGLNSILH